MPTVWFSLKKSLNCTDPQDVYDPKGTSGNRSGSIVNHFKDVVLGSKRFMRNGSSSPSSIASEDFCNNMPKEAMMLSNSAGFETKIMNRRTKSMRPMAHGVETKIVNRRTKSMKPMTRGSVLITPEKNLPSSVSSRRKVSAPVFQDPEAQMSNEVCICLECSQHCMSAQGLQSHQLTNHGVTELKEGDSTRTIVEIIFKSSWLNSGIEYGKIERVLRVNNTQKALAIYEEYRETVMNKASKLPKKHPRCLADGNEMLRFHGTTIMCSLGTMELTTLCTSLECNVCNIIRTGGLLSKGLAKGKGIYTTSTSLRAHKSINLCEENLTKFPVKRAMLVCRVIAGRVHKPLNNYDETVSSVPAGFDSVAGDGGVDSKFEELYVSNPRAVLPCFFVVYA